VEPDSRFVAAIPGVLKFSRNLPIQHMSSTMPEALWIRISLPNELGCRQT
jgi:hypothetical protein